MVLNGPLTGVAGVVSAMCSGISGEVQGFRACFRLIDTILEILQVGWWDIAGIVCLGDTMYSALFAHQHNQLAGQRPANVQSKCVEYAFGTCKGPLQLYVSTHSFANIF